MLELYFFNVGHGDSIAISFPGGCWGIIDCNRNTCEKNPKVLSFLKKKNIQNLSFVCITHPHYDHFKGIDSVVDYYGKNIDKFIIYGLTRNVNETSYKCSLGRALITFMKLNKKEIKEKLFLIKRNDSFNYGGVTISCLNPTEEILDDLRINECYISQTQYNNASVVLQLHYLNKKVLLCADSTVDNWRELLICSDGSFVSDIIKISHHGSRENNTADILNNIVKKDSSISIISTDGGVHYKSVPSQDIINYLKLDCNSDVCMTSELPQIDNDENGVPDLGQDALSSAAIEAIGIDVKTPKYDGLIKVCIDSQGNVNKEFFNSIDEVS